MRSRFYPLIGIVLIITAALSIYLWKSHHHAASANEIVLYGNVDIRQVQLAFNDSERISAMNAKEGDRVVKGQLLATLELDRLRYTVERAGAQVQAQEQVVARMEAGSRPEEIRKATADLNAAIAEAENSAQLAKRRSGLVSTSAVSKEEADQARFAAEAARARADSAREALRLAIEGPRKEDIAAAKATLQSFKADLDLAVRQLADGYLYAPSNGVIQDRILEPGDMASPQKPVYTLALTDPIWVRAYVSETDLGKLRMGMRAIVTTDSYPGQQYRAWVGFISPTAQFTPKSVETVEVRTTLVYQVRIFVCNPEDQLRLGMPATVIIPLSPSGSDNTAGAGHPCS